MGKKRAQITIFLVAGIILLILFSIALYYYSTSAKKAEISATEMPLDAEAVKLVVEECIKEAAKEGIFLMSYQGGERYTRFSEQEIESPDFLDKNFITMERMLPYYAASGNRIISEEQSRLMMEENIGGYIEDTVSLCTDFSDFILQGIYVEEQKPGEKPKASVTVGKEEVKIELQYPLNVIIGAEESKEYNLNKFSAAVPARLGTLLLIADQMSDMIKENPTSAHLPEFMELNKKNEVMISILPYDEETTVYTVYDDKKEAEIDGSPLIFWFAVKNDFSSKNSPVNSAPRISNLQDFVLKKGMHFEYELIAVDMEGDAVAFSSDNPNIPIQQNGLFNFTPQNEGEFYAAITAIDSRGLSTEGKMRFVIEK